MPTIREFWLKMKSLLSLARQAVNTRLSKLELTSAAGDIIFQLIGEDTGLLQEELRERLNIGKAAISRTVDSLILKGYVQKLKHPVDARACLVSLTEKGMGISTQVSDAYNSVFRIIQQTIPEEDFLSISQLLDRIQSNLTRERTEE